MDIFDLALQYNDFEWARELAEMEQQQEAQQEQQEPAAEESNKAVLFDKEAVALESILIQYAVKENKGIRAFNINSTFDRNEAEMVIVEKPPYSIGEPVKYHIPTKDELSYMRGLVNGYQLGYRDAYSIVNNEYSLLFEAARKTADNKQAGKTARKKSGKKQGRNGTDLNVQA